MPNENSHKQLAARRFVQQLCRMVHRPGSKDWRTRWPITENSQRGRHTAQILHEAHDGTEVVPAALPNMPVTAST